ncbi:MAG: restriction endonuclease [Deltaproteobacteria bacterium]|nr:restriction endonuclease [Deltaproteobacteria bacterium]
MLTTQRKEFHRRLATSGLLTQQNGVPSNADSDNKASRAFAKGIAMRLPVKLKEKERAAAQSLGSWFEEACRKFLTAAFADLSHLRPGSWQFFSGTDAKSIEVFEQYKHLRVLEDLARTSPEIAAALGSDYTIKPDIVIARETETDESINAHKSIVNAGVATMASLRRANGGVPLLHASVSCKWTIRSDRSQNSRTEALNLLKNRKGRAPHIVVVTAEPTPSRLASIALGTGEIDCVYHFALPELAEAVADSDNDEAKTSLQIMVDGGRLKDIADLPLDLAI